MQKGFFKRAAGAGFLIPLFCSILFSYSTLRGEEGTRENALWIDSNVRVLGSQESPFLVSIYFRHSSDVDVVHFGLDYDELLLQFNNVWSLEGTKGVEVLWYEATKGHVQFSMRFDPFNQDENQILIKLEFSLLHLPQSLLNYGNLKSAQIRFDDDATYFENSETQEMVDDDFVRDGSVSIYIRDALEVGSARISPDWQIFRIPVFVTRLESQNNPFSMELEYDQTFLDLIDVEPVSPHLDGTKISFGSKNSSTDRASVECPFLIGICPPLLRHHMVDLVFEYREEAGVPINDLLFLTPIPKSDGLEAEGGAAHADIRQGMLYIVPSLFLRGDTDSSGRLELNDAILIIDFLTGSMAERKWEPDCMDAMDTDGSGQIDIADVIRLLGFLFRNDVSLAPPPTGDNMPSLGCSNGIPVFELLEPAS